MAIGERRKSASSLPLPNATLIEFISIVSNMANQAGMLQIKAYIEINSKNTRIRRILEIFHIGHMRKETVVDIFNLPSTKRVFPVQAHMNVRARAPSNS